MARLTAQEERAFDLLAGPALVSLKEFVGQSQALQHVNETSYQWSPEVPAEPGKVVGKQLRWGEFLFLFQGRWYRALQMNAPSNPVEEFSMREYGRFGFFFRRELEKNQILNLRYGFVVTPTETPTQAPVRTGGEFVRRKASDAPINVGGVATAAFVSRERAGASGYGGRVCPVCGHVAALSVNPSLLYI